MVDNGSIRVGIVGAGLAGLACAKVLTEAGHEVQVLDRTPDVGGVWSETRRYPGLRTQNSKRTYCFSDFPMPASYPMWPTGTQMQAYLHAYAERFALVPRVRHNTEVVGASLDEISGEWTLTVRDLRSAQHSTCRFDYLVIANGVFSDPHVPDYPGLAEFERAGGMVLPARDVRLAHATGKNVVVVGYGKSACDVAHAVSDAAASTVVVARRLMWKLPRMPAPRVDFEQLVLTRLGEALFPYAEPSRIERFLLGRGKGIRDRQLRRMETAIITQLQHRELGLVPDGPFEEISNSSVSLVTEGFFDKVRAGLIRVRRGVRITRLVVVDGRPRAVLSDGELVAADTVVCATGFHQRVPFLDGELQERLTDDDGNFQLYRQILPLDIPRLAFAGYNSSLISTLNAETAAHWIAGLLAGQITLPSFEQRHAHVQARVDWMQRRTFEKHAHATSIAPFSLHNTDEMLNDLGRNLSRMSRAIQWIRPARPRQYRRLFARLTSDHLTPQASARARGIEQDPMAKSPDLRAPQQP